MLAQLLKAEVAEREVRSIAYHMKAARVPAYKDLSGFDFAASEINEATVRQLHRGRVHGRRTERCSDRRTRHRQNACRDSPWRAGCRASPPHSPLLLDHRIRQHA